MNDRVAPAGRHRRLAPNRIINRREISAPACLPRPFWSGLLMLWLVGGLGYGKDLAPVPAGNQRAEFTQEAAEQPPVHATHRQFPGPLLLEDPPQPLVPKQPQSEAQRDRLHALALFATGRLLERQQDYAGALRKYQRTLRYDPGTLSVVQAIIVQAVRLKRFDEALYYRLKEVELGAADPVELEGLGDVLASKGDLPQAVKLYERALAVRGQAERTADAVRLWWKMGWRYSTVEDYERAADSFARVIEALDDPEKYTLDEESQKVLLGEPDTTYNLIGECFLLADRPDEAVAAFKKANELAPNEGLLAFHFARVMARTGQTDRALASLQVSFDHKLASEGTLPYRLLAELLKGQDREPELLEWLERLHAEDPDNIPLGYFLAETYLHAELIDKAEPLYIELVRKTPTPSGYQSLVDIYRKASRPEALLKVLGEVVEKTASLEVLGIEGQAVWGDAATIESLVETARRLLRDDPGQFGYEVRLAVALVALEGRQFDTAGEFFDLAIQAKPDSAAEILLIWGLGLLVEEKPAEATRVFQRGIDSGVFPEDSAAPYYYQAGALALDDRIDEALAAAREAVRLNKDSPQFLSRVAWILFRGKRYEEATQAYTELINKLDSDYSSPEVRRVMREARLALSNLAVLEDHVPQAEEWLEQVLDEFPDDIAALNDLGYLWAEQGKNLRRASRMIRKAIQTQPDNTAYRDSLGWVLYQLGEYERAVAELEDASASDRPDAVILDHLGDALLKAGRPDEAKDAWRRAAQAFRRQGKPEKAAQTEAKISQNP